MNITIENSLVVSSHYILILTLDPQRFLFGFIVAHSGFFCLSKLIANFTFTKSKQIMKPYGMRDEQDVLRELQRGDQLAFSNLFRQFQPALVFFANRLLFSAGINDAQEIVQDIFVKFYDRKDSFTSVEKIKAFLYISTKNACMDRIAKEQVHQRRYNKFMESFNEVDDSSIVRNIIYAEVIREVSHSIELLPPKCREIMERFFKEGKDAKEIAEELNLSVSTVNNQKARAISLLKKGLSGAGMAFLLASL